MTATGAPHDPENGKGCKRCDDPHMQLNGKASCHSHIYNSDPPIACRANPVDGEYGSVCRSHGGTAPRQVNMAKKRRGLAAIHTEMGRLGGQIDVDPSEAMIIMVREAASNVVFLRGLVEQLHGEVGAEGPTIIDDNGVAKVSDAWVGAGVAQRTSPDDWKADPHVLVKMYNDERDRLVKYAKMCRDAGVDERMVQIAEAQGMWLVSAIDRVLDHLNLSPGQREQLPAIMGQVVNELEAVEITQPESEPER